MQKNIETKKENQMSNEFKLVDVKSEEFKKCVREIIKDASEIIKSSPVRIDHFIILSDGWILDVKTGLEWGPSSDKSMNFSKSEEYCKNLGGRLPSVDELQTILDRSMHNPTADKNIFKDVKSEWYWTGTKYAGVGGASWCVSFYNGCVNAFNECNYCYVRPVRASQ